MSLLDLNQLVHRLEGARRSGAGYDARCPAHEDRHQSLSIASGDKGLVLYCHAGCQTEDVLAALGLSWADVFEAPQTASGNGAPRNGAHGTARDEQLTTDEVEHWHAALKSDPEGWRYVTKVRGFTPGATERLKLGLVVRGGRSYLAYPYKKDGHFTYAKLRSIVGEKTFLRYPSGVPAHLYGVDTLGEKGKDDPPAVVIVFEGEGDVVAAYSIDLQAEAGGPGGAGIVSIPDGVGSATSEATVMGLSKQDRICIAFDADEPGEEAAQKLAQKLGPERCFRVRFGGFKDLGDALAELGPDAALDVAVKALREAEAMETREEAHAAESGKPPPSVAAQAAKRYALTDLGNAERFAFRNGALVRYVHGLGWHVYDGRRWASDMTGHVERLATDTIRSLYGEAEQLEDAARQNLVKHALRSERAERISAVLRLARAMEGISIPTADLDREPHLLNVENGTIDLRSGELLQHDRSRLISKLAPVAFDPAATRPTWDKFVRWAFMERDDLVSFVQRMFGYWLTGYVTEQAWFLLHGGGQNGKTTFLETVQEMMGDYAVRAMPDALLAKSGHPTEVAALAGSRLALAIEPETGKAFRDGLLKALTGEAQFTARLVHKDPFTFAVTFKIAVAANHLPAVRDDSDGFWRRVRLVPFENRIEDAKKDPRLKEKLRAEWPGILAWGVRGTVEWFKRGLGTAPEVDAATRSYREEEDLVRRFTQDACALEGTAWVKAAGLYAAFQEWCDRNGEPVLPRRDFTPRLLRVDGVKRSDRGYGRGFAGIKLRQEVTE